MANVIQFTLKGNDRFSKSMKGVGESLKKFGRRAGIAMGLATAAITAMTVASFRNIDVQAKLSDKLGITTEAYAGLKLAAELTGTSFQVVDLAIKTLSRNVVDFSQGVGEAKEEFEQLGVTAEDLINLSPDQQFALLADKINLVTNSTDRLNISQKLFGGRATALLNTLKLGSKGLADVARQADKLGLAVSRVDAAKIEQANDAVTRLKGAFTGISNQIAISLAPSLQVLAKAITDLITDSNRFEDEIDSGFKSLVNGVGFAADAFHGLSVVFTGIKLVFAELMNFIIQGMIKVPQITAEALAKITFGKVKESFLEVANTATEVSIVSANRVQEIRDQLEAKLLAPLPSESIKIFAAEVEAAAQKTADSIAALSAPLVGGEEGEEGSSPLTEAARKDLETRLAILQEGFLSEEEAILLNFEKQEELLALLLENKLIKETEHTELLKKLIAERQNAIFGIEDTAAKKRLDILKRRGKQETDFLKTEGGKRTSDAATFGGQIFKQQQITGAGIALIGALTGAARTLGDLPFPANIVAAAGVLAKGLVFVAAIKGAAAGGLENVPSTGTFLLHQGERVLSAAQNADLTRFLQRPSGEGGGRSVTIENLNVHVLENATTGDALLAMDSEQMREVVAGVIIPAFDELDDAGVRPKSSERGRT